MRQSKIEIVRGRALRAEKTGVVSGQLSEEKSTDNFSKYLVNCFLLMIPVLLWNVFLVRQLPASMQTGAFWKNIPAFMRYGENLSRMIVIVLPLLMPLEIVTSGQKAGLLVYGIGILLYFLSWATLILAPTSQWSTGAPGSLAPALTPLIWLIGIGMVGRTLYVAVNYKQWMYFVASMVFVAFHTAHTLMIYLRSNEALKQF